MSYDLSVTFSHLDGDALPLLPLTALEQQVLGKGEILPPPGSEDAHAAPPSPTVSDIDDGIDPLPEYSVFEQLSRSLQEQALVSPDTFSKRGRSAPGSQYAKLDSNLLSMSDATLMQMSPTRVPPPLTANVIGTHGEEFSFAPPSAVAARRGQSHSMSATDALADVSVLSLYDEDGEGGDTSKLAQAVSDAFGLDAAPTIVRA